MTSEVRVAASEALTGSSLDPPPRDLCAYPPGTLGTKGTSCLPAYISPEPLPGLRVKYVTESPEPPLGSGEERAAYNEDWCRDVNERKARWRKSGLPAAGFRCEC